MIKKDIIGFSNALFISGILPFTVLASLCLISQNLAISLSDTFILLLLVGGFEILLFWILVMERKFNLLQAVSVPIAVTFLVTIYFVNYVPVVYTYYLYTFTWIILASIIVLVGCMIRGLFYESTKITHPGILERKEREAKLRYKRVV